MCVCVQRWVSITRSISSGAHLSISTRGCPMCRAAPANWSTAVWYSGEQTRWTLSSNGLMPKMPRKPPRWLSSGSLPGSGRRMPRGRPVVPEV